MSDRSPYLNDSVDSSTFKTRILYHLKYSLGKKLAQAQTEDLFRSVSLAVRELIVDGMFDTAERYDKNDPKLTVSGAARGLSGSYVMNRQMDVLVGDARAVALIEAAYRCL